MGEEGNGKALLCPDARENLWFSVQTIVASLQKILFKGCWYQAILASLTEFAKMQILLHSIESVFRYFLAHLTNQGAVQTSKQGKKSLEIES